MSRRHTFVSIAAMVAAAVIGTACTRSSLPNTYYAPEPTSPDLITWNDLVTAAPQDAFTAVQTLRPFFLTPRPSSADVHGEIPLVRVFINGDYAGDADVLRLFSVRDIESIRRLQPTMAFATMSTVHPAEETLMVRLRCRGVC